MSIPPNQYRATPASAQPQYPAVAAPSQPEEEINLRQIFGVLQDNKWLIGSVTAAALALGVAYALLAKPVYESNLLIHVEDNGYSPARLLGEAAANMFNLSTTSGGEMEIIRSRQVLGKTVDNTQLYISASPEYLPYVGSWLARRASGLSTPSTLPGMKGKVSGTERIEVAKFEVPSHIEGQGFTVTAGQGGQYTVSHPALEQNLHGRVGETLETDIGGQLFSLEITRLDGNPGALFTVTRNSRINTIQFLQRSLQIQERGRQTGIINVAMRSEDPYRLTTILNEIGNQYVLQNIARKAADAAQSLQFLDEQLPVFKRELENSEAAYTKFRNQHGTVAFDEEARLTLSQIVNLRTRLLEAEQSRRELETRFTSNHPTLQALDSQIAAWKRQIGSLESRVQSMPTVQQEALRYQRDIQVNTALYQSMLNNALQLRLVKEGRTGNVRLIDNATILPSPVAPRKSLIVVVAGVLGLATGIALAIARNMMHSAIRHPNEIEERTGQSVFATIPLSSQQKRLQGKISDAAKGTHLLATTKPSDPAVEGLRSLRTALQFSMLDAPNNRVVITGPTPGVGKSFISANFAAIMAAGGKRVLLIDSDLRKGYLHQYFGLPRNKGLSEILSGQIRFDDANHANILPNLDFISTGALPVNPSELLLSEGFSRLLEYLSSRYDLVLIDSAPVLVAADTNAIAPQAGSVLLVARAEQTLIGEVNESIKRLAQAGKNINGVIFNALDPSRKNYGKYGHRDGAYTYKTYRYYGSGSKA